MPDLVEILSEFSKGSKKQPTVSDSNMESTCAIVSRQKGEEEARGTTSAKMRRSTSTLSEAESTICILLMDRFAPS